MKSLAKRFLASGLRMWNAFGNADAWVLIIVGILMFSVRTPLPQTEFVNLPYAATVIQTAGLMFAVFGFQLMASVYMWPTLSFKELIRLCTMEHSVGAATIILGLLIFNGLCMVAFTVWLSGSLAMGAGAR